MEKGLVFAQLKERKIFDLEAGILGLRMEYLAAKDDPEQQSKLRALVKKGMKALEELQNMKIEEVPSAEDILKE